MAVYTRLTQEEISAFIGQYDLGTLREFKGIAEGVENTNYQLTLEKAGKPTHYILTLYEQRVNPADLPFFLQLTEWLADRGIVCPRPAKTKSGELTAQVAGQNSEKKTAAIIHFLPGRGNPHITPAHLELTGALMARMHKAANGFPLTRANSLSLPGWQSLFARFEYAADTIASGLHKLASNELFFLQSQWPRNLPQGVIHADIFPDNVFFIDGHTDKPELSGIIDFYFACNDALVYDLAITLNAWCFDLSHNYVPERGRALLKSYHAIRPLSKEEKEALPILCRGAAIRFLMTRAHDWLHRVEGALVNPKDPKEYVKKLRVHQNMRSWQDYGWAGE
ncbi:MAG: homoserine kinase [Rickettsiales bacterium]|nr:homoserine kinase [Rickettsiales bacterium]